MTDRNKFEQMLEHLINEESDKAKELFHQIVVEKSREIYEQILSEDFDSLEEKKEEDDEEDDEELDEAKKDEEDDEEDEEMDESFGFAEGGDDTGDDVGGDAGDDMIDDLEADDEGDDMGGMDDMGGEEDLEDRVMDLEDALDELRSEFESLMADEGGEDHMGGDDMGMGDDDMDMGMGDEDEMELEQSFIREYTEKVSPAKMGDNGANARSVVAGKNDMGGSAKNLVQGGEEATSASTKGGLLNPSAKVDDFGNINKPGGYKGDPYKKNPAGHGAEKKGSAPQEDKGAGSPLNGAPKRAK